MSFDIELLIPSPTTVFIAIATLLLLYWIGTKNHDYFKKNGIPYAKPFPFIGTVIPNIKYPLVSEIRRYKKYGRIYGHYEGTNPLLSVADPELLRNIFVKDFQSFSSRRDLDTGAEIVTKMLSIINGEDWKRLRTIVSPAFTTGKIKRMMDIIKDCANTLISNLHAETRQGKIIDTKRNFGAFTMDVIASSAFSTKIDSHNDPNNTFVTAVRGFFSSNFSWRVMILFLAPSIMKLFRISIWIPSTMKFFKRVTLSIIEERKRTGQKRNDFLQLLLDAAEEESEEDKSNLGKDTDDISENYGADNSDHQVFNTVKSKKMSMEELIAQCVVFFIAGYDTTASTLSFLIYNLALNPDVQEKAQKEIDAVIKASKGELTYEAVQKMKYLDNVISESLRIFPPVPRLERVADVDYKLGDTGITVPKGMIVTIPIYAMQQDPEHYPNPEKFDPDRFSPEEREKRNQYTYFPFGAGPRNCVGMRFALMEVKICLILVLSHFKIHRCPQTKVPLEYYIGQGILGPKEIVVKLDARSDCPLKK